MSDTGGAGTGAFLLLRRCQKINTNIEITKIAPSATPTPMPAFAPLESPEEDELSESEESTAFVDVALEGAVRVEVVEVVEGTEAVDNADPVQ